MKYVLPVLLWICAQAALAGAPLAPADAIDIAGRQRMLSQRIVKAYAQVALGVTKQQSERMLADSVARFEQQARALREHVRSASQRDTLARTDARWKAVRASALAPATVRGAASLNGEAEELLRLAQLLAGQIEDDAPGLATSRVVNVAGRQRMLSQRLAKSYMLRALGVDSRQLREEMDAARFEFDAALQKLKLEPQNTPEIQRELEAISVQWDWFRTALDLEGAYSYRQLVADASESILASMENVVALYIAQAKR